MFAQLDHEIPVVSGSDQLPFAGSRSETVERALFFVLIAGLAWVPYWYGSNELVAWGINAVLFPGLAVCYETLVVARGEGHAIGLKAVKIPATLFIAVVLWILLQNATWTPSFLHHPVWGMTADALGKPVEGSISVNRDLTILALVRLITAASVFWLALQLCRNGSRSIQFIWAIAIIVGIYCIYGLVAFAMVQSETMPPHNFVTSTFYNHNHFATYAGIGLIAASGLILRIYQRESAKETELLQFKIASFLEATQKAALPLGIAFLIFVSVLLTGSRGGIAATSLGLTVLVLLPGRARKSASLRAIISIGALLAAAGFFAFGDILISMVGVKGLYDEHRVAVQTITLRSVFDAPLLGYGYGTFMDVFPMLRDRSIGVQDLWEQAHNTYLEVVQGLGVVFGATLIASVMLLVFRCVRGATVPRISVSVASLVGIHALVDFSIQIQAVSLTFMAILGAGCCTARKFEANGCDTFSVFSKPFR